MKRLFLITIALASAFFAGNFSASADEAVDNQDATAAVETAAEATDDAAGELAPEATDKAAEADAVAAEATDEAKEESKGLKINPKEIIFEHLGDRYGWEVPFDHHHSIPLPVIVWASDGLHAFSSARIEHHKPYVDGNVIFMVPEEGDYHGKVVEVVGGQIVRVEEADGKIVEKVEGGEIKRPLDFSITKNVCAIFITIIVVCLLILPLPRFYRKHGMKAPRRLLGAIEALVVFVYEGVIKSTLKENANRFAPFLLTVFFFIFTMNLMGLIVVFPGGANVTGNIAVTLVLAVLTFFVTNIFGTKHYWKDIFWPDVPLLLKFPIPIMPVIEVFGIFTKPAALTVRLFANMMGGHMIVIVLTLLIFIFCELMGAAAAGGTSVISVLFSVFMLLLDVLVSFIQAFVFTMLSTIFISLAQENPHKEHHEEHAGELAKA